MAKNYGKIDRFNCPLIVASFKKIGKAFNVFTSPTIVSATCQMELRVDKLLNSAIIVEFEAECQQEKCFPNLL